METTEQLPYVLGLIRLKLDLTQEELADKLGVSFATVNRWEQGHRLPQKAYLVKIIALANKCGVDMNCKPNARLRAAMKEADEIVTVLKGKKAKKPFPFDCAKGDPLINKNSNQDEYFRAMTDQEVDDFIKGKF
jgi:type I restriction enzyme M protein